MAAPANCIELTRAGLANVEIRFARAEVARSDDVAAVRQPVCASHSLLRRHRGKVTGTTPDCEAPYLTEELEDRLEFCREGL